MKLEECRLSPEVAWAGWLTFGVMTVYAAWVYVDLGLWDVLSTASLFAAFISFLLLLQGVWPFGRVAPLTLKRIGLGLVLSVILLLTCFSPGTQFIPNFFPVFPLLESDMGVPWHQDTAFHTALIQSIVNFGYPSIGQHGTPLIGYHVLSHYVDAAFIKLSGVDAWNTVGLFYHFKTAALLVSILFFLGRVTHGLKSRYLVLSVVLVMPMLVYTWHAIGSQGLWVTTLVCLFTAPFVFRLLAQADAPSLRDFAALFLLVAVVSLGKVSSGFAYAMVIGLILWFRHMRCLKLYVWGVFVLVFFAWFKSYMSGSQPASEFVFSLPVIWTGAIGFLIKGFQGDLGGVVLHNVALIGVMGLWALLTKNTLAKQMFAAMLLSFLLLLLLLHIYPSFHRPDKRFFMYGLLYAGFLMAPQLLRVSVEELLVDRPKALFVRLCLITTSVLIVFAVTSKPVFNVSNLDWAYVKQSAFKTPFLRLSKKMDLGINHPDIRRINRWKPAVSMSSVQRPVSDFKLGLQTFMQSNSLRPNNTLLFVPMEVWEEELKVQHGAGRRWPSLGTFLYAVTGVPMVHGVQKMQRTYGFSDYSTDALWRDRASFDEGLACQMNKNIVQTVSFNPPLFDLTRCSG